MPAGIWNWVRAVQVKPPSAIAASCRWPPARRVREKRTHQSRVAASGRRQLHRSNDAIAAMDTARRVERLCARPVRPICTRFAGRACIVADHRRALSCVYHEMIAPAKQHLKAPASDCCRCPTGFPAGLSPFELRAARDRDERRRREAAEIDILFHAAMSYRATGSPYDEMRAFRGRIAWDAHVKADPCNRRVGQPCPQTISRRASLILHDAGADFIQDSTGKESRSMRPCP